MVVQNQLENSWVKPLVSGCGYIDQSGAHSRHGGNEVTIPLGAPAGAPAPLPGLRSSWHRWTGGITLAWLLIAALAAVFNAQIPLSAWLIVHLALLGAASNALLIWSMHFTRAIVRARGSAGGDGERGRIIAFNLAVVLVFAGILLRSDWLTLLGTGGVVMIAGAHGWALWKNVRGALPGHLRAPAWYYAAAALLLVPGALVGWLITTSASLHSELVAAHVTLNVLGWVGIPIIGTLITLWPTVLHVRMDERTERLARRTLPVLVAGVLVSAFAGFAYLIFPGSTGDQLVRMLTVLGLALYVGAAIVTLAPATRVTVVTKVRDYASLTIAAGTVWLLGATTFAAAWIAVAGIAFTAAIQFLLAPLLIGIMQVLLGSLAYLLPVMAGGGPTALKWRMVIVNRWAISRALALNTLLVASLFPLPPSGALAVAAVALLIAVASLVLIAVALYKRQSPTS